MRATFLVVLAAAALTASASAQLTDLQAGRNYPTRVPAFGGGLTENIDVGDVDNDGDLDVGVCNGGDGAADFNRIYINQGGLQGGTLGTFIDETAARFAGIPADTSRDIEFVDLENDGDLDIYISNRGSNLTGEVSRFYVNQGGLQGGTLGFYVEDTANRWGTLVSVDPGDEVGAPFGEGAWRDWSCDCDFADLDDDGDADLFHSSYGPALDGSTDSRVFLNDGTGTFHEEWPWANPGADIRIHTLDIDLADFDGDYDLDVFASSRDSQARFYVNNCYRPIGDQLFTDTTQSSLIDNGVTGGGANYEAEFGDLDGDGDFDVWMKNFPGLEDNVLRNDGTLGGAVQFSFLTGAIKGDPNVDENEVDLLDYDGDGDLDVFLANFSGTNWLYVGGIAQGLTAGGAGLYHRSGTSTGGSLASWDELPEFNGGTSLDGEAADMDNDGDVDLLIAQDGGAQNRYYENALGVPDTHAPTFERFTDQCDKPVGSSTIIHAQVRDNHNYYMINYYDVDLVYEVNGGPEQRIDMFAQGGQQFRAVIPPQSGNVAYWIEATDRAGNTGVSAVRAYEQSGPVYANLGGGTGGSVLSGTGTWEPDTVIQIDVIGAPPSAVALGLIGFDNNPTPAFGGTIVPVPWAVEVLLFTDGAGELHLPATIGKRLPCGLVFYLQWLFEDGGAPGGVALSNALRIGLP